MIDGKLTTVQGNCKTAGSRMREYQLKNKTDNKLFTFTATTTRRKPGYLNVVRKAKF